MRATVIRRLPGSWIKNAAWLAPAGSPSRTERRSCCRRLHQGRAEKAGNILLAEHLARGLYMAIDGQGRRKHHAAGCDVSWVGDLEQLVGNSQLVGGHLRIGRQSTAIRAAGAQNLDGHDATPQLSCVVRRIRVYVILFRSARRIAGLRTTRGCFSVLLEQRTTATCHPPHPVAPRSHAGVAEVPPTGN